MEPFFNSFGILNILIEFKKIVHFQLRKTELLLWGLQMITKTLSYYRGIDLLHEQEDPLA